MITTSAVKAASVLFVGNRWFPTSPGGAERYLYELMQHLVKKGDRVELCAMDLPNISADASFAFTNLASVNQSLLQRLWSSRAQFRQRTLLTPDAVSLHFALYSFPILRQLPSNVPVTFHFHGPWALESLEEGDSKLAVQLKDWLEQQVYRRCDRFIVLSKAFGVVLHESYGIPWHKIHIIPGGVDTVRFQPNLSKVEARKKLGWDRDRPILFTPRRLVQRMGLDKLLLALVQVKRVIPDVWLVIAGKGNLRETLERQVQELDLGHHVQFLGFVPDEVLPVTYQAADLTIVPSQSLEGFGLILVESLACGTPALCTPIGGMPEILAPLNRALITESPEAGAIAERLIDILKGAIPIPSRAACRTYAQQNFDWQLIAPQIKNILLA